MRNLHPIWLLCPNLLFFSLLRSYTPKKLFLQGDIRWHSFTLLRSFSFLCFQVKKMSWTCNMLKVALPWPFKNTSHSWKQTKGTPEESASLSWPYLYLHPSFLRPNMQRKMKKQNTLRYIFFLFFSFLARAQPMHNSHECDFFKLLLLNLLLFLCYCLCKAAANGWWRDTHQKHECS